MAKLLEPFGGGLQCDDPEKNVFDIHGGGIDLVFPHHENEIAQSCCAFGTERMANVWMHNGFLQVEGKKMSKSEGNFVTINELLETEKFGGRKWPGEVLRLAMLMTHYREPIDFSVRKLEEAENMLRKWKRRVQMLRRTQAPPMIDAGARRSDRQRAARRPRMPPLMRTLHRHRLTPRAVGDRAGKQRMRAVARRFGAWLFTRLRRIGRRSQRRRAARSVEAAIAGRLAFIRDKNWAEADRIRDELLAQGIQLKDGKDPATGERITTWEVKR